MDIIENSNILHLGFLAIVVLFIAAMLFTHLLKPSIFSKIALPSGRLNFTHKNLNNHFLVLAASSAGKTKSIIEPLVEQVFKEEISGVIYDFKFPDVASFNYSLSQKSESRMRNWYVNFHDVSRSHRINPLANIESVSEAVELSETLIQNLNPGQREHNFWTKSGTAILGSVIYFLSQFEKGKYSTLPHVIEFIVSKQPKEIIDIIFKYDPDASKILSPVATGRDSIEQLSGQVSTIQADLSRYANEKIYWVLSENSPGFRGFDLNSAENPARLIVGNDPENPGYSSPLVGLIFSAAFRKMMKQDRTKSIMLMDEAGTFSAGAGMFEKRIVTCRSYGIAVCMALQDYAQLEKIYGEKSAQEIRGSCNSKGFGRLSEGLDYIQKHFGTHRVKEKSTSTNQNNQGSSRGSSYSYREEPRVKAEYVSQLMPGEFIFDSNGKRFKERFRLKDYYRTDLPEYTYVSTRLLRANYSRIEAEIQSIR